MARPLRVEFPGAIDHVTDRMVGSRRDERLMQKLTTGLTQRRVAALLGMKTGAAVSVQVKKYELWLSQDKRLGKLVQRIESCLNKMRERN